jgi:hypothetical protein
MIIPFHRMSLQPPISVTVLMDRWESNMSSLSLLNGPINVTMDEISSSTMMTTGSMGICYDDYGSKLASIVDGISLVQLLSSCHVLLAARNSTTFIIPLTSSSLSASTLVSSHSLPLSIHDIVEAPSYKSSAPVL